MTRIYNDPAGGNDSSIGGQIRTDFYKKKALVEAAKEMYFGQMADTTAMPKHFGKKIKLYHYLPMLDDANINDQGIDASGNTSTNLTYKATIKVDLLNDNGEIVSTGNGYVSTYFVGEAAWDTDDATTRTAAVNAAKAKVNAWCERDVEAGGLGLTLVGGDVPTKYTDAVNSSDGLAYVLGYRFSTIVDADAVVAEGNLYGSSKDVGTIAGKLPTLSETGGRVNRVGFTRVELEGTITKYGFFEEYTQESMDFDTDEELEMHVNREMVKGANEIVEDKLQIDLLNSAGVVRFGGSATATHLLTGDEATAANNSVATYDDLVKLDIDLNNNRCPKNTKIITGSRMIDTRVVDSARYMFIGSELLPMVKRMTDYHGNQAFIPVQQYANAGNLARGEVGAVDQFRIIVVPEMMHWEGAGLAVDDNEGYREGPAPAGHPTESEGTACYNVYPMLVVGSGSFTTIGFQTDGKTVKFSIKHSKPGSVESYGAHDPYGELGFMSIKWYYGFMVLRPERIALLKCVAEW